MIVSGSCTLPTSEHIRTFVVTLHVQPGLDIQIYVSRRVYAGIQRISNVESRHS